MKAKEILLSGLVSLLIASIKCVTAILITWMILQTIVSVSTSECDNPCCAKHEIAETGEQYVQSD